MSDNRIILPITPQPHIKFDFADSKLFYIPEVCVSKHRVTNKEKDKGKPCKDFVKTGKCPHILSDAGKRQKQKIERYNKYRADLFHLAKVAGLQLMPVGMSIYFHFPMRKPPYWPKKKRAAMMGQPHLQRPDCDNIIKAMMDSLTGKDENIAQLSGTGKFWTDQETGFIEILFNQPVYNPYNVVMMTAPEILLSSYEERLKQRQARKKQIEEEKKLQQPKRVRKIKPLKLVDELK